MPNLSIEEVNVFDEVTTDRDGHPISKVPLTSKMVGNDFSKVTYLRVSGDDGTYGGSIHVHTEKHLTPNVRRFDFEFALVGGKSTDLLIDLVIPNAPDGAYNIEVLIGTAKVAGLKFVVAHAHAN